MHCSWTNKYNQSVLFIYFISYGYFKWIFIYFSKCLKYWLRVISSIDWHLYVKIGQTRVNHFGNEWSTSGFHVYLRSHLPYTQTCRTIRLTHHFTIISTNLIIFITLNQFLYVAYVDVAKWLIVCVFFLFLFIFINKLI